MGRNVIDISGETFGELTVLERAGFMQGKPAWLCRCSCGNVKVVKGTRLKNGNTRSCGHLGPESRTINLTGRTFGRLVVVDRSNDNVARWNCKCACGRECVVSSDQLLGGTKSCGCLAASVAAKQAAVAPVGARFNSLVVLAEYEPGINGRTAWLCECDCGSVRGFVASEVKRGKSKNCGCVRVDKLKAQSQLNRKFP